MPQPLHTSLWPLVERLGTRFEIGGDKIRAFLGDRGDKFAKIGDKFAKIGDKKVFKFFAWLPSIFWVIDVGLTLGLGSRW